MRPGEAYDCDVVPWRYSETECLCMLAGGAALTVQPWADAWPDDIDPVDDDRRAKIAAIVATPDEWRGEAALGDLLVWASRRAPLDLHRFAPGDDDSAFQITRYDLDEQPAHGGVTVNRRLVREALQPWVQQGYASCSGVDLRIAPGAGGHVLMLATPSRSTWALVMSVRGGVARPGTDAMPGCWWRAEQRVSVGGAS